MTCQKTVYSGMERRTMGQKSSNEKKRSCKRNEHGITSLQLCLALCVL